MKQTFLQRINPFSAIHTIWIHLRNTHILQQAYKSEQLIERLSKLLKVNVKKDWIGRLYFVVCPSAQHVNEQIYEITDVGYNNEAYVAKWLMTNFMVVSKFITQNNLFDLMEYHISEIDDYNFLVILQPITFEEFKHALFTAFCWLCFIACAVALCLL